MSTTQWNPASHLVSPDGKWYWDGAAQEWKPIGQPASEPVPTRPPAPAQPSRGLNSFAAVFAVRVAFPTPIRGFYTSLVVGLYGVISLATATTDEYPAVFTRLLTLAAVAVCGNLFARHEAQRREVAIRIHDELLDEIEQGASSQPETQPAAAASCEGFPCRTVAK